MEAKDLEKTLAENDYPGRGIIVGKTQDAKYAVAAYWIMGRSENSRNRVFVKEGDGIKTRAWDPAKLTDPSLIIYDPVKVLGDNTIVTNGDQTLTVYEGLKAGLTFEESLRSRKAEPDAPNFTPRISALLIVKNGTFNYSMSILKTDDADDSAPVRQTFSYENPRAGLARYIHTYLMNANPLPSFEGEPELLKLSGNIDELSEKIWKSLNSENKVSLFVRFIEIETGKTETRIINRNN